MGRLDVRKGNLVVTLKDKAFLILPMSGLETMLRQGCHSLLDLTGVCLTSLQVRWDPGRDTPHLIIRNDMGRMFQESAVKNKTAIAPS